ncbi:unnamed protein product [Haemonchus placei]|uniref:C2HC/C3H-type domain-containing protein n=1 Tax=Haemonchus placei TaxID=6290 RepID=A0A3P7WRJ1_HAEPC|nr:unnamed protein product [Haemonchus placei]
MFFLIADYVQCDYCGRNFSESAAERHIPFCKEQSSRKGVSSTIKPLTSHRKQSTGRHEFIFRDFHAKSGFLKTVEQLRIVNDGTEQNQRGKRLPKYVVLTAASNSQFQKPFHM